MRRGLAADIARRGLLNPLIILNHPRRKCRDWWLMVGQNRLAAVKALGWETVPAVVTGSCPYPAQELESWEDVLLFFRDGEPYLSEYGIAVRGNKPPETYT